MATSHLHIFTAKQKVLQLHIYWRSILRLENTGFFEQSVILTHPPPSGATSQGGKAAVFTSSLQNESFATSHLFLPLVAAGRHSVIRLFPLTTVCFRFYRSAPTTVAIRQVRNFIFPLICISREEPGSHAARVRVWLFWRRNALTLFRPRRGRSFHNTRRAPHAPSQG